MDQTPPRGRGEATPPDELLLAAYRETPAHQKQAAADQLFARYYERVGRWCYRFTGERESAADLAQDVFLKAHRHLDSFQGTAQFGTWLYSIVRNEGLNRARRNASLAIEPESEEQLIQLPALEPDPEELASQSSTSRRLHQLLNATLDETERTVFTLHYGEDVPLETITRLLRLENNSGAKAYIVSAKRKLSRAVERWFARGEKL
jgi:RNA polymerase sigma-70 factor (ECF subfamily)